MSAGNEPAYPAEVWRHNEYKNGWVVCGFNAGLSKRELIAAMAMQGLLSCEAAMSICDESAAVLDMTRAEWIAKESASMTDALLAQLSKDPQP